MPTSPLQPVRPGAPLVIRADDYNAMLEAARAHQLRGVGSPRQRPSLHSDRTVWVRNDSGADRARYDVLGISGPIIEPADRPEEFARAVQLAGVVPTADHVGGRWCVLAEPIAAGRIGRAWADGVCPVSVNLTDETHQRAEAVADQTTLQSAAMGSALILWLETGSGTGARMALVHLACLEPPSAAVRMRVKTIQGDYLSCLTWDGSTEGTDPIAVARPWDLRRSPFDGQTVNGISYTYTSDVQRTATLTGVSEIQLITPDYFVDAEIFVISATTGVTASGNPVHYLDLNTSARAWYRQKL